MMPVLSKAQKAAMHAAAEAWKPTLGKNAMGMTSDRTLRDRTTRLRNRLDAMLHYINTPPHPSSAENTRNLINVMNGIIDIIDELAE
jgi:hypothetical protein